MAPLDSEVLQDTNVKTQVVFRYGVGAKSKDVDKAKQRALRQPRGLQALSDGSLLVADFGNSCVVKFAAGNDAVGKVVAGEKGKMLMDVDPLKDIDKPTQRPEGEGRLMKRPVDVAEAKAGSGMCGVVVLDSHLCALHCYADNGNGVATTVVPRPGSLPQKSVHSPESLKYPRAFLPLDDGTIILCDTWSHRVLRFSAQAEANISPKPVLLAGCPNSTGTRANQLAFPSGILLDNDGSLLVADTNNHRVQRFPPLCDELEGVTEGPAAVTVAGSAKCQSGGALDQLNMPTGICLDPRDGSLLVADRGNSRVLRFPAGSRGGQRGEVVIDSAEISRPWGVSVGPDGSLYVSDELRGDVLRLNSSSGECRQQAAPFAVVATPPATTASATAVVVAPPPPSPRPVSPPLSPASPPPPLECSVEQATPFVDASEVEATPTLQKTLPISDNPMELD
eukprot:TRINITY_DN77016_c0_g1_i1.p1 TRINITY_DN77016_c0_g1~~TRINITY_DN77016_c0_g1_i1.p1  ORF type:complete len:481 (-),score=80.24 TRINITY_DN77016_c0_g1_i1:185-1537(-)